MSLELASVWRHKRVWLDPQCLNGNDKVMRLPDQHRQRLRDWVNAGRPLIGRAWTAAEDPRALARSVAQGVPVGLALRTSEEKVRMALVVQPAQVVRVEAPLLLRDALDFLPAGMAKCGARVVEAMNELGLDVSVYGSAFWSHAGQASCMTPTSDLDLLLRPVSAAQARRCLACLSELRAAEEVRLDGEMLLPDGSGVAWAELDGRERVMVKTQWGPELRPAAALWALWS